MDTNLIIAFKLGVEEADGGVGMTYDGDAESPRSVAYDVGRTVGEWSEPWRSLLSAAPDLLQAARCALADLEGIMPEYDSDGDRTHPGWQTIADLKAAIANAERLRLYKTAWSPIYRCFVGIDGVRDDESGRPLLDCHLEDGTPVVFRAEELTDFVF